MNTAPNYATYSYFSRVALHSKNAQVSWQGWVYTESYKFYVVVYVEYHCVISSARFVHFA